MKTEERVRVVYPVTWTPPFQGHAFIGDSALQGQTRRDIGVPAVKPIRVSMQGDMGMRFVFLFRAVAGCHNTHPDSSYYQAADFVLPPWWGTGGWLALHLPLLHHLGRQVPGPARLSSRPLVKALP